ncbi:pimeloyl-ACP methyl ester carboxylesterase [Stackebrandtia endophytica]|uniref:Pimeloyl-ACP methyl ester carboxylesterase n=1 Tax=Stackebrandtia endophytica TaxID=1496996 RepID=A0A543AS50_9ACTN|nr:alpha/beta hydrolase [Stackebrandtia endophytica]TQL75409.1 pimeloyl-ACP methyl ester carboxylesterase [Stackebrandtia endophytica]
MSGILKRRRPVGHWRDLAGFQSYRVAYDEVLSGIAPPTRRLDIATDFGSVRVYEWTTPETAARPPVLLLPGVRSGAPMWTENLPHWINRRTVYAMDAIGDAGMSTQSVPFASFDDQAAWVEQLLGALGIDRIHVVGHSFGGAIGATHALRHPSRVASLTLLEPVIVLHGLPASMYLWAALLVLPLPQSWKDLGLARIGGVSIEEIRERTPLSEMIDRAADSFGAVNVRPRTFSDDEWRSLSMPVRIDLAATSSMAGGDKAAERARRLGKDPVTVWPETTHSLPMQAAEPLGPELERYWTAHDR